MYVIIGYTSNINLDESSAEIRVLCGSEGQMYWKNTKKTPVEDYKAFKSRTTAEAFIEECDLKNCIVYKV